MEKYEQQIKAVRTGNTVCGLEVTTYPTWIFRYSSIARLPFIDVTVLIARSWVMWRAPIVPCVLAVGIR